jgi:hypothetical protein
MGWGVLVGWLTAVGVAVAAGEAAAVAEGVIVAVGADVAVAWGETAVLGMAVPPASLPSWQLARTKIRTSISSCFIKEMFWLFILILSSKSHFYYGVVAL